MAAAVDLPVALVHLGAVQRRDRRALGRRTSVARRWRSMEASPSVDWRARVSWRAPERSSRASTMKCSSNMNARAARGRRRSVPASRAREHDPEGGDGEGTRREPRCSCVCATPRARDRSSRSQLEEATKRWSVGSVTVRRRRRDDHRLHRAAEEEQRARRAVSTLRAAGGVGRSTPSFSRPQSWLDAPRLSSPRVAVAIVSSRRRAVAVPARSANAAEGESGRRQREASPSRPRTAPGAKDSVLVVEVLPHAKTPLAVTLTTNIKRIRGDKDADAPWRAGDVDVSPEPTARRSTIPVRRSRRAASGGSRPVSFRRIRLNFTSEAVKHTDVSRTRQAEARQLLPQQRRRTSSISCRSSSSTASIACSRRSATPCA